MGTPNCNVNCGFIYNALQVKEHLECAGHGGLVVGRPTAVQEDPGSNLTAAGRVITTVTAIYSLGHGLCTLTAVPRSTQPSTLRGTVK